MKQTEISFSAPVLNTDGSPIVEPLSYIVAIDTVSPPQKQYAVPTTISPVNGVTTVKFSDIGFAPVQNTAYFADVVAFDADGASIPSTSVSFKYDVVPSAPTGLTVG